MFDIAHMSEPRVVDEQFDLQTTFGDLLHQPSRFTRDGQIAWDDFGAATVPRVQFFSQFPKQRFTSRGEDDVHAASSQTARELGTDA